MVIACHCFTVSQLQRKTLVTHSDPMGWVCSMPGSCLGWQTFTRNWCCWIEATALMVSRFSSCWGLWAYACCLSCSQHSIELAIDTVAGCNADGQRKHSSKIHVLFVESRWCQGGVISNIVRRYWKLNANRTFIRQRQLFWPSMSDSRLQSFVPMVFNCNAAVALHWSIQSCNMLPLCFSQFAQYSLGVIC